MRCKKQISLVLSVILILSLFTGNLPVFAQEAVEENAPISLEDGLCVHHSQHSAECGYAEEREEQACGHIHDENCGYAEACEEIPCDAACTDTDGDGVIDHGENCSYQPAREASLCTHQHDENCGWAESTEASQCSYAVNGCPYCVTGWNWPEESLTNTENALAMVAEAGLEEEQEQLEQTENGWVLTLSGIREDDPMTREELAQSLPGEVSATTDSGETLPLALSWDLTSIPEEGASEGTYTLTAALADTTYALTEDAAPLAMELRLEGAELYNLTLPSGTPPYSERYEYGVSPSGTTIDLFDYWLTGQTDSDNKNPENIIDQGINNDHTLLFGNGMKTYKPNVGDWNYWTGRNEGPRTGIVSNRLENGYPRLNVDISKASDTNYNHRDGNESLAYLFDPNMTVKGKASYPDVKGLLQVDSDGYYYYNSQENYAVYYNDTKEFTLYNLPGVYAAGTSPDGQFFPFNAATADGNSRMMNNVESDDTSINHYFGIHMSTRFIQQYGGHTDETREKDVTYTFSGDDDVWIFIDDVLVADLGGIHDAASTTINFATGEITINGVEESQSLGTLLGTGSHTLTDNTYHTLDFFYLERGNVDSNMNLKYNLVTIPESDLIKIDQMGDPVPGAEFSLYAANDYKEPGEKAEPIATGTTNASGEFVFLDENGFPLTIQNLYDQYGQIGQGEGSDLVLVETVTPPGYRTTGATGLYFYETQKKEVLLLSNSVWDEGAYAMAKVTSTAPNKIQLLNSNGSIEKTVSLMGQDAVENPLMFAVVLQKQSDGSWRPVSGDPINGWTIQEDSTWDSILTAARSSRYIFQLASSGAYQVEISNLPGDIKNYYHVCLSKENAEYTVGYYYTEAGTLSGATAENTWRIDADPTDEEYELDRVFSMDLYVSNIKNNLIVQKVDELGNPVNGAEFALYSVNEVTIDDGKLTPHEGADPRTLTTDSIKEPLKLDGSGVFQGLNSGEYYLVETGAPKGYELNDTPIHVLVDDTGVYAYAGTNEDGVTVLRGAGSVVRSMLQFAADDDVDATLNGIKAALAQNVSFVAATDTEPAHLKWGEANWNENEPNVLHLQYANANGLLDYGLYDTSIQGTLDNLTLATDAGWSKLLVRQCYQHDESVKTNKKENLGDQDITKLFSTTSTVRVENERTGDLKITKTVSGDLAPENKEFSFRVTVLDDSAPLSGTFTIQDETGKKTIEFTNGMATFKLLAGGTLTILDLPADAAYQVEEIDIPGGFSPAIQVEGDETSRVSGAAVTGTIIHTPQGVEPVTVNYTNSFDGMARVNLEGIKTMAGRSFKEGESYSFTLSPGDEATRMAVAEEKVILPKSTEAATEASTTATAAFRFGNITFKEAGTYVFQIKEKLPEDVNEQNPVKDGVWYDTHTATATVIVTKDENSGLLSATVDYSNSGAVTGADEGITNQAAFTNRWANLTLSKKVTGNTGDRDKAFKFRITLTDSNGTPLTGSYSYTGGTLENVTSVPPADGILTLNENGIGTLELKHGQTITLYGVPVGSQYTIEEPDAAGDGYTITVTVGENPAGKAAAATGSLSGDETEQVAFVNHRETTPATGILLDNWPWLLCIGIVLAGTAALLLTGRRYRQRRWNGRNAK